MQNTDIQMDKDAQDLAKFGYVQELFRGMKGFSSFAISFSVISILTGATQLYGYGLGHGGPLQITGGWLLVSFFTMTVAMAMAELASAYPTAGAMYHWASFLGGRTLGWVTACFNTIGQFAILAGIDYGLAKFSMPLLGIEDTPTNAMLIYAALLFSHAFINHVGIKLVAWLNDFSAWYHVVVVVILIGALALVGFHQPVSFLVTHVQTDSFSPSYSFLIGLLLAQWTLTGYDASAHVTEEIQNPRINAPRGIIMAVLISIISGFLMLAAVTLSIDDLSQVLAFGDAAFFEIMKAQLGAQMGGAVVALVAGAMWLCGLASMASSSRMVYAFARDGGLPFSRIWSKVESKHHVPVNAIYGITALALGLGLSVKIYSAVVSIATISLYISYGLPIMARLKARLAGKKDEVGPWNLGRLSSLNAAVASLWVLFITVVFVLPPNNQALYIVLGLCGGLVVLWFGYVRSHFKGPKITLS